MQKQNKFIFFFI